MDGTVSLSTDASAESSGPRVSTRPNPTWVSESRVGQPANESWSVDWWSDDQPHIPCRSCTSETRGSISAGARPATASSARCRCLLADKITEVMRDQFGTKPKVNSYSYRTPYPPAYDLIPLPNRYKVPDFTKFSGQDDTSTMEHVHRFIIQFGEAANRDELRVRLFSSSLSGSAFTWFISLPPNSVITWADLEKQFHKYFFSRVHEKKITDLVRLKQRNDESVESFV